MKRTHKNIKKINDIISTQERTTVTSMGWREKCDKHSVGSKATANVLCLNVEMGMCRKK